MKAPSPASLAFAERLRSALRARGHTQRWLAAQLGTSDGVVNWWLKSRCMPANDKMERIAQVVGVSARWLITGFGEPVLTPVQLGLCTVIQSFTWEGAR